MFSSAHHKKPLLFRFPSSLSFNQPITWKSKVGRAAYNDGRPIYYLRYLKISVVIYLCITTVLNKLYTQWIDVEKGLIHFSVQEYIINPKLISFQWIQLISESSLLTISVVSSNLRFFFASVSSVKKSRQGGFCRTFQLNYFFFQSYLHFIQQIHARSCFRHGGYTNDADKISCFVDRLEIWWYLYPILQTLLDTH